MSKDRVVKKFLTDSQTLFKVASKKQYKSLSLPEYPFDSQLLSLSRLYRKSRQFYFNQGGRFVTKVCSTPRSLSSDEIFADEIEYSPLLSEWKWFTENPGEVAEPLQFISAISCFSEISLFHEQNHRILWNVLPPAPSERIDFCRYLNLAESLVVTLDLALGDEIGPELSPLFERFKVIYRPCASHKWAATTKAEYRQYLLRLFYVTYLALELIEPEDIPKAVKYVFGGSSEMNKAAVKRGLELSETFTLHTNRLWQHRHWASAQKKLEARQKNSSGEIFLPSEDPLDFQEEFILANKVFDFFNI